MFCRFLTGFFQVFISIYYPVWSDTFGFTDKIKTMWLTLLLLCGPIGTLIGYLLGGALVGRGLDWRYAFYIQTSCLIPVLLSIIFTPVKYLDLENRDMQITPPIPTELVSPPANPRASF